MQDQQTEINWKFWLAWVFANAVGWIVGMTLSVFLGSLIEVLTDGWLTIVVWAVIALIAGLSLGINQWFVMRAYLLPENTRWLNGWVVVTTLAWAPSLVVVVALGVGEQLNFASSGAIIGMTMGIAQYFVLFRKVLRAEWWAIANTIGWMAGLALADVIDQALGYVLAGGVSGAITGLFLVWLLNHPIGPSAPISPGES